METYYRGKVARCSDCPCVFQSAEQLQKHLDMRIEDPTLCVRKEHGPPAMKHARMVGSLYLLHCMFNSFVLFFLHFPDTPFPCILHVFCMFDHINAISLLL